MDRNVKGFGMGLLALAAGMASWTLTGPRPTEAATALQGSAPVTVVNTPLPVALQGTGSITGQVSAAQSGAWSVGVTSLPAVQLAPGTTVNVQGGGAGETARQAYALNLCATLTDSCSTAPQTATLPLNTRFVIEFASGSCYVRNAGIDGWKLTGRLNGQTFQHIVTNKIRSHDDESTTGLFSQPVRFYIDGGEVDGLSVSLWDAGYSESHDYGPVQECDITLSGYLVDTTPAFPTVR
jgi:hypothetical protein